MKLLKRFTLLCVALVLPACSKPRVTGSYIFKDSTTIDYITLIESPDGRVEGQLVFASTSWQDVPGFAQVEGKLSGVIKGSVINMTLSSPRWSEPTPMSGTFDGGSILLTTRGANPMRFIATTPERYEAARSELIAREKSAAADR